MKTLAFLLPLVLCVATACGAPARAKGDFLEAYRDFVAASLEGASPSSFEHLGVRLPRDTKLGEGEVRVWPIDPPRSSLSSVVVLPRREGSGVRSAAIFLGVTDVPRCLSYLEVQKLGEISDPYISHAPARPAGAGLALHIDLRLSNGRTVPVSADFRNGCLRTLQHSITVDGG